MDAATVFAAWLGFSPTMGSTAREDTWSWNAPSECPSGDAVRAQIERHLGQPMARLPLDVWSVVGTVTRYDESGYAVALVIDTPDGRHDRLLHDPVSCEALSNSAALLIALALSPDLVEPLDSPRATEPATPEPEPEPEPEDPEPEDPEREPEDPEPEPEDPEPEPEESGREPEEPVAAPEEPELDLEARVETAETDVSTDPLLFAIGVAPGMDWGTLRGVSPQGRLVLAWQFRRLRVSVAGRFSANPPFDLPPVTVKVGLWSWSAAVEAGPVPSLGRFEFPIMAGVEAGQLVLTPAVLTPGASQVAWAALLVTPGVSWVPLPWFALTAQLGTTVAFVRPRFTVPGLDPINEPSRVGVRASLGVEFRVPLVMKKGERGNQP